MSRGAPIGRIVTPMFDLQSHGADTFVGEGPRYPWGGLYGGQIVAQALRAAAFTGSTRLSVVVGLGFCGLGR